MTDPKKHDDIITVQLTRAHCEALIRATFRPLLAPDREYSQGGKTEGALLSEARAAFNVAWYDESVAMGRAASIAYRVIDENPAHTTIRMFIGRTPGARGNSGQLIVRTDELAVLTAGGWERLE